MNDSQIIPSPAERRRRRHEQMRATILEVARELMRVDGAGALSWNEIARRVGLKPPSLYVYFDDKMALYDALFRQGWAQYGATIRGVMDGAPAGWEGIRTIAESHFQYCLDNPELFQIMFQRPIPGFEPSAESLELSFGVLAEAREHFVQVLAGEEMAPQLPGEMAFDLFIATLYGITAQHLANEPALPLGEGRFGTLLPAMIELFKAGWGGGA